jgi:uncharacterized protein YdhG (YjbR/CyaY superfamily)
MEKVDQYIASFPKDMQKQLKQMRALIKKAAPKAEEIISYNMPAYKFEGRMLAWFAGYKNHVGLYPMASGIAHFKKEIGEKYKFAKGSVQFPADKALPITLITRIIKFRVKENKEKAGPKKKAKK